MNVGCKFITMQSTGKHRQYSYEFLLFFIHETIEMAAESMSSLPVYKEGGMFLLPHTPSILFRPEVVMIQNFTCNSCQNRQGNMFSLYF